MKKHLVSLVAFLAVALALAPVSGRAAEPKEKLFTLGSPAFKDNAVLPLKYAGGAECGANSRGGNQSPPLAWSNPPSLTKSFAIIMIDPDGRRGEGSVHWIAYNIPASESALKPGAGAATPSGNAKDISSGKNSRGLLGYTGPCGPPADGPHHYVIDVLALDLVPGFLQPGLDRDAFLKMIAGHSIGPASLVVRYRRNP